MMEYGGSWKVIGLYSWATYPCNSEKKPGVYTRVAEYIPWIEEIMQGEGHTPYSY